MRASFVFSEGEGSPPCVLAAVVVDKLEKLPREKIEAELAELGVAKDAMDGLLESLSLTYDGLPHALPPHY